MRNLFLAFGLISTMLPAQNYLPRLDIQGHRGCRGLMPENSIPGFIMALDSGATTLEMDLAISHDGQVVVSHEPWMNAAICLTPEGREIKPADEKRHNLYRMNYEEIKLWDCGSKGNARFPEQQKIPVWKPLLLDVIRAVEKHIRDKQGYEVDYNLEIKSMPAGDHLFHPAPAAFSDLVFRLVDQYLPWNRVVIQSFDFRVLKYWHEKYPHVRLAALVDNPKTIDQNLQDIGFTPAIYSPNFRLISKNEIEYCHSRKMRIVPWTVNEAADIRNLIIWRADGIISDYPNRVMQLKKKWD